MYLQHFGLEYPPFTRRPSPDVFFVQAGRKDIFKNLRDDLRQGETAMLLTGPQGAGKTILCRLIRRRLDGSSCTVVHLENPAGSFDDLLTQVCLKLGMPSDGDTEQDISSVLRRLIRTRKEQGRQVLLLIDEAEKMFLAALERLFRLLNELNATFGTQFVLVGQPALNTSLEQLSGYCEDVRISFTYSLAAFSVEETGTYLAYRLKAAGDARGAGAPVFSDEAVQKIFRLGHGLPGVMDGIAESSLEKAAAAGEQTVLPAHVAEPDTAAVPPFPADEEEQGKGRKAVLLFVLVLCLIAFLFWGKPSFFTGQKETSQDIAQEDIGLRPENTEISIGAAEDEPLPFVEEEEGGGDSSEKPADSLQTPKEPSLFSLPVPERLNFRKKDNTREEQAEAEEGKKDIAPEQAAGLEEQIEQQIIKNHAGRENDALPETAAEPPPALSPDESEQAAREETSAEDGEREKSETLTEAKKLPFIKPALIIELTPGMKKTRPAVSDEVASAPATDESDESDEPDAAESRTEAEEAATAPPEQKTLIPVASARVVTMPAVSVPQPLPISPPAVDTESGTDTSKNDTPEKAVPVPEITIPSVFPASRSAQAAQSAQADQLYARYLGAGNRWTEEGYGDKFTVQLFVFSSDDAAEKIKEMIVRDEYQEHKRKLYILRRNTQPPTLFVCYGVYSSMDEARNAGNTMPLFLRKHHPYALSISDVLAKAGD